MANRPYKSLSRLFVTICVSVATVSPVIAQQIDHNDLWLVDVQTPLILERKQVQVDITTHYTDYRDARTGVRQLTVAASFGLLDHLSCSVVAPALWQNNHINDVDVGDFVLFVKYKIIDKQRFDMALSPALFIPTGSEEKLQGSGHVNFHVNLNMALRRGRTSVFSNLGFGKTGYVKASTRQNPSGSTSRVYKMQNEPVVMASGGVVFIIHRRLSLLLEGVGQIITEFSDKDAYFQTGAILRMADNFSLKGSVGMGLPHNSKTMTKVRGSLGLSYLFD